MNSKTLLILAIVFAIITIILGWISGSNRFDINIPWYIANAPGLFFIITFLLPYSIHESKKKDKEKNK